MFGQSTRKCGCLSPAPPGTSQDSTASRLTLPSARNGSARTHLPFHLRETSHFSRRRTASTTRRSQKFLFVGSQLIQNMLGPLSCVAAIPRRFMLRPYRRFHPLPRRGSTTSLSTH